MQTGLSKLQKDLSKLFRRIIMQRRTRSELDNFDDNKFSNMRKIASVILGLLLLATVYMMSLRPISSAAQSSLDNSGGLAKCPKCPSNKCFYGSKIDDSDEVDEVYSIKIVSDLDKASKFVDSDGDTQWKALLWSGTLTRHAASGNYSIAWGQKTEMRSMYSFKGRGMELSELVRFDGRLLSFDDTTGIVYEIIEERAVPWTILVDGNRRGGSKGFKSEWATVKGNVLYVGSIGKEWTHATTGEVINKNPQFVKTIDTKGHVTSHDWSQVYNKLREATGTANPGYMVHESANWHPGKNKWVFLPRRMSTEAYNEVSDERRAANTMILADQDWQNIQVVKNIGPYSDVRGFSSFRFVPNHDDDFVALKSVEDGSTVQTYITVLNMKGEVLMPEQLVDNFKFEGLEIVP